MKEQEFIDRIQEICNRYNLFSVPKQRRRKLSEARVIERVIPGSFVNDISELCTDAHIFHVENYTFPVLFKKCIKRLLRGIRV